MNITQNEKVLLFRQLFTGLTHVYGTYSLITGHARQVKAPVTDKVILSHLAGRQPYGVYLLMKNRTLAVAADFDEDDPMSPVEFAGASKHFGLPAYIERSKSKGYHAWIFFNKEGVSAAKARLVVRFILDETDKPGTEIFPKHDELDTTVCYGNFINAPLFGRKVAESRTVFLDPHNSMKPYQDQWDFLANVKRVPENVLDEIIEINGLDKQTAVCTTAPSALPKKEGGSFGLLPCARQMLEQGVSSCQRVSCFRLAVHLKKLGVPYDITVAALTAWALKNKPINGKRTITKQEIIAQTRAAFEKKYTGYGCSEPAIIPYCNPSCSLHQKIMRKGSL